MSWDHTVYLARKRIAKTALASAYRAMQAKYGRGHDPDELDEEDDREGDELVFARFRFRLVNLGREGFCLVVTHEDASLRDLDEVSACMEELAELLGGALTEDAWRARQDEEGAARASARKVSKFGPPESVVYVAFDAAGKERGRKTMARDVDRVMTPKMLLPEWLRENEVTHVESASYDHLGELWIHESYEVKRGGRLKKTSRD